MSSDEKKTWGTIFLDADRESSLSKLDAMQAASRKEQYNQRSQQDYLEKVRQKAIDRAREILGEAYTERQSVLDEAERDAERIRAEARATHAEAQDSHGQAQDLRYQAQAELDNATHIRNAAHEEGFQAGLAEAQDELNNFRMAMGSSVAGVLHVIESQCMSIFSQWRSELVDLVKASVKYGTSLALSERHEQILESMLLEAVRHLDDKRSITLRVHPEDEPVVADLFAAAKERNPDLGMWKVTGDPNLNPGDIIAESLTGSVDSRVAKYLEMVENIVQHLSLPETSADNDALGAVHETVEEQISQVESLLPPPPEPEPEPLPEPAQVPMDSPEDMALITHTDPNATHTPEGGATNPEERAAIGNLFSMGDDDDDFAADMNLGTGMDSTIAPNDILQNTVGQPQNSMESLNAIPHMNGMSGHDEAFNDNIPTPRPQDAASMSFTDGGGVLNEDTENQDRALLGHARTMQELEDELLGNDLLPSPLSGDEGYFTDEPILKGKA